MHGRRLFRRSVAWPADHGSWAFLLSPLIIGLFAGGRLTTISLYLVVAACMGHLIRQPITIAVKVLSRRRPQEELPVALFWTALYAGVGLLHVLGLALRGFGYLLVLAVPGMMVFAWYLVLVSRRQERRQLVVELLAAGVLALIAPAGLWAGVGAPQPIGWLLWLLVWCQSAASILHVHLRLDQRRLESPPTAEQGLAMARASLTLVGLSLLEVILLGLADVVSLWLWVPYLVQAAESLWGALRPALGTPPSRIGLRQVAVSALFTLLFVVFW
jgi:hypothetical protein